MATLDANFARKMPAGKRSSAPSPFLLVAVMVLLLVDPIFVSGYRNGNGNGKNCVDKRLEEREEMANVVISGTVKRLQVDAPHSVNGNRMFIGDVEIIRVFKGENTINRVAVDMPGGVLRKHKMVKVEGFGAPWICENHVRIRDTKIFLLNLNGNGMLALNSSVLPVTVNTLGNAEAAVKDIPFEAEKPKEISPCYMYFCPFGAVCHVNTSTNTPMCLCEQQCSQAFAPVCGSDGVTYTSACMLERSSCLRKKSIRVKSQGNCGVRDPCEGVACTFGAECKASVNGDSARCQCPSDCPSFGDSVGSKPICGNNGVDYANICELRKAACSQLKDIRMKYYGKCDPCEGFTCESPKVCQVNDQRQPECKCNYICQTDLEPVCGTDGRTYSNACVLRKESCKKRQEIKVLYKGSCSADSSRMPGLRGVVNVNLLRSGNNPCNSIRCGPAEECTVDRQGRASCVCPPPCQPVFRRVCGNDSRTYDSECEMRRRSCLEKVYVTVAYSGPCGSDAPCTNFQCDYGAVCVVAFGRPTCKCPQCSEEYDPVCGDNDITYDNECKMRQENCEREETVLVKKRGTCDDCGSTRCDFYGVCESVNGKPRCVCPTSCVQVHAPVCGSDGKTYLNECELRVRSCQTRRFLSIATTGTCDKCEGVTCKFSAKCENGVCVCPIMCRTEHKPVCGSDGKVYINKCEMEKRACSQSIEIEETDMSECDDDIDFSGSGDASGFGEIDSEEEEEDNACSHDTCFKYGGDCVLAGTKYRCSCENFNCPAVRSPVCGSDGRLYGNKCQMQHQACVRRQVVFQQSMENCDEFDDEEPCDGGEPLINPLTGRDYDCTDKISTCPPNSYCHRTITFAKCCRDDTSPVRQCSDMEYGCCKDGKTPARGPRGAGCPGSCRCNPIGSYSSTCDPRTSQCTCKPGVGGKQCDRCEIGYWGLHRIVESGNSGCIACNCNKFGSDRDDCDQMTGRCMCRPLIRGMKCDLCSNGRLLGPEGCKETHAPSSCEELNCRFGAVCRESARKLVCVCAYECDMESKHNEIVCGTDGQNYGSECQLRLFACRLQKDMSVAYVGSCKGAPPMVMTTPSPSTSRSRKTTRHINGKGPSEPDVNGTSMPPVKKTCDGNIIDQLCLNDEDCCPEHSRCHLGLCTCMDGFIPDVDNSKCYEVVTPKPENPKKNKTTVNNACVPNPCLVDGLCVLDDVLGFRCICKLGRSGPLCNRQEDFSVPSFSGRSFLELPLIRQASQDLSVEIVFNTLNKDGVILFNARFPNGTGDFVSLAMNDGFIEFRYDLGAGPAILRSRYPAEPTKTHRVIMRRLKEAGILIIDKEEPVTGSSPSTLTSLNLNNPLFLGYIPKASPEVFRRVGTDLGLVGCIHSLRAGSRDDMYSYNLALIDHNSDVINGADITDCGTNPCKSMPCKNGATCLVLDAQIFECRCKEGYKGIRCEELRDPCASQPCQFGGICMTINENFYCQCTPGREGLRCEKESIPQVFVPQFTGDSYMDIPLDEKVYTSLSVDVWFKAMKPDGVLLFGTQAEDGKGDFFSLNLVDKKLVYKFFLGSGIAKIESKKRIRLDKWHKVSVMMKGSSGQMTIDGHTPVRGEAPGSSSALNIDSRTLFLGGYRSITNLPNNADIKQGFSGAIQRIIINGKTLDNLMLQSLAMGNISRYEGPPCNVNPCMNGGVCVPVLNTADCRCPAVFMGDRCEKRSDHVDRNQPVKFDEMTFLNYPSEISQRQEGQQTNNFEVTFRTTEPNGMLLFQNKGESVKGDYLSVAVVGGRVELSYNLGKQNENNLFILRSQVDVTDGNWHTVKIVRHQREGSIQVDDEPAVVGLSDDGTRQLDTDGELWVGGKINLPWGLPPSYYTGFNGCVDAIKINGQDLHLIEHRNGHSSTISFCT